MNKIKSIALLASCYLLTLSSPASAVMVSDVIDASSGQPGTYFVPGAANPFDLPYFRYQGEDWEWQHNAIANTITSAELSISAWDVDNPSTFPASRPDEIDRIQAFNNDTASWETVGELAGATDIFSFTTFNLDSSWFDEIALGLKVQILIDELNSNFWGVSLAKSVLSIDGAPLPDPNPDPVPVPAAVWLFGTALLGLIGFGRRKAKA